MKALIYKEFKLAVHPLCYFFILFFPAMILIPSYPIAIGFIYILVCYPILFLGASKGEQSNDLLFSTLLPVRKKDVVLARIITILILQATFILVMSLYLPLAIYLEPIISAGSEIPPEIPGLGLKSYVLNLGICIIGLAISDLIYLPIYYRKGLSLILSSLCSMIFFGVYISVFTIALPCLPEFSFLNSMNLGYQFIVLAVAIIVSFLIHLLTYKISAKLLDRVDF